jgi:hypothetical protein
MSRWAGPLLLVSALMGVGGCGLIPPGWLGVRPDGAGCPSTRAPTTTVASPIVPDNAADIVSLDHVPELGSGDSPDLSQFAQVVRAWGADHSDAYAGLFLANGLKGGNTLSDSRELVIAAVDGTLPDASADIPHLPRRPYCLPLTA